ncbi:MAG TPA: acyl-CoA carboxylase subunit epsilon [Streptosporangiaceae bacterium]|nr:acyl-CoA carboxylase subunit epsilon [Streptosporangiaceae bacterium]
MPDSAAQPAPGPVLHVVRGKPTPAELAAVIAVLGARSSASARAAVSQPQRSRWAARNRLIRQPVTAGPGAWRSSALPG